MFAARLNHRGFVMAALTTMLLVVAVLLAPPPAAAQGVVIKFDPIIQGTLGDNGWYTSTVTVSYLLDPTWIITEGCQTVVVDYDTGANGAPYSCAVTSADGLSSGSAAGVIRRDATPPAVQLISPAQPQVNANEGSTLVLNALAQDLNLVASGWDLDGNGTIDAANPASLSVPGLRMGGPSPCFIAEDAAGHRSVIDVQVNIINLAPNIDGWVVPSMIHFGGTLAISATVSDPGGDALTASVNWGDGSSGPAVFMPDGSLQAAHDYAGAGSYPVTLTVYDSDGAQTSATQSVKVESPIETIEGELIPGTRGLVNQGLINQGQADSLVVKLEGTVAALQNDRPAAANKLSAYLNEFAAVVPNASLVPCFLVATDVRDALLNGLVAPPN